MAVVPYPLRLPNTSAHARRGHACIDVNHGPTCEVQSTHVRQASHRDPIPSEQQEQYTNVHQRSMNTTNELNFIRSAKAPEIRAGVMTANMHWNIMNVDPGIVMVLDGSTRSGNRAAPIPFRPK